MGWMRRLSDLERRSWEQPANFESIGTSAVDYNKHLRTCIRWVFTITNSEGWRPFTIAMKTTTYDSGLYGGQFQCSTSKNWIDYCNVS